MARKDTEGWALDEHGHMVARLDATDAAELPKNPTPSWVRDGNDWRTAATYDNTAGRLSTVEGLSIDGNSLIVRKYGNHDKKYLEALPSRRVAAPTELFSNPSYDAEATIDDPWTERIVGVHYIDDKFASVYFDPELAHVQKRMEAALAGPDRRALRPGTGSATPIW